MERKTREATTDPTVSNSIILPPSPRHTVLFHTVPLRSVTSVPLCFPVRASRTEFETQRHREHKVPNLFRKIQIPEGCFPRFNIKLVDFASGTILLRCLMMKRPVRQVFTIVPHEKTKQN